MYFLRVLKTLCAVIACIMFNFHFAEFVDLKLFARFFKLVVCIFFCIAVFFRFFSFTSPTQFIYLFIVLAFTAQSINKAYNC